MYVHMCACPVRLGCDVRRTRMYTDSHGILRMNVRMRMPTYRCSRVFFFSIYHCTHACPTTTLCALARVRWHFHARPRAPPRGAGLDARSAAAAASAMSAEEIAAQIRGRAAEVQADRQYLGFFEWLHFAALSGTRRFMVFGSALLDLESVFAPGVHSLLALAAPSPEEIGPVACAGATLEAHYDAEGRFHASHFVLGVPVAGEECARAHAAFAERSGSVISAPRSLHTAALSAGYGCILTVADGDCGPDTMCMLKGWGRSLTNRRSIRAALAEALRDCAEDPAWQSAWVACQENVPHPAVREDIAWEFPPGGGGDANGADDWSAQSAPEERGPLAKRSPTWPGRSASAAHPASAAQPASAEQPASAQEDPPAPAVLEVHLGDLSCADPNASFEQYVAALPGERQQALCQSYDAWAAGEKLWQRSLGDEGGGRGRIWPRHAGADTAAKAARRDKRRQHLARGGLQAGRRETRLQMKLALARQFQEWRQSAEGQRSRAPYADFVRSMWGTPESAEVPKAFKMRLKRAEAVMKQGAAKAMLGGARGGCPKTIAESQRPRTLRCRMSFPGELSHATGGPLQEELWHWFLDIRSSVCTYMPAKVLLMKTKEIAGEILRASAGKGHFVKLPRLDGDAGRHWHSRA